MRRIARLEHREGEIEERHLYKMGHRVFKALPQSSDPGFAFLRHILERALPLLLGLFCPLPIGRLYLLLLLYTADHLSVSDDGATIAVRAAPYLHTARRTLIVLWLVPSRTWSVVPAQASALVLPLRRVGWVDAYLIVQLVGSKALLHVALEDFLHRRQLSSRRWAFPGRTKWVLGCIIAT